MSKGMDWYLDKYGESHQNPINKLIHWVCVPAIVFSVLGLLFTIPFPLDKTLFANWAAVFIAFSLVFYLRLSLVMAFAMAVVSGAMLFGIFSIYTAVGFEISGLLKVMFGIFVVAWIVQFIGHKIEGQKPSFLEDVQFLMIGPAWLLSFIFKKIGIKY